MFGTYLRLNVAVWSTDRAVIRAARLKITKEGKGRAWRTTRHAFLRRMLAHHAGAQELCRQFKL